MQEYALSVYKMVLLSICYHVSVFYCQLLQSVNIYSVEVVFPDGIFKGKLSVCQ